MIVDKGNFTSAFWDLGSSALNYVKAVKTVRENFFTVFKDSFSAIDLKTTAERAFRELTNALPADLSSKLIGGAATGLVIIASYKLYQFLNRTPAPDNPPQSIKAFAFEAIFNHREFYGRYAFDPLSGLPKYTDLPTDLLPYADPSSEGRKAIDFAEQAIIDLQPCSFIDTFTDQEGKIREISAYKERPPEKLAKLAQLRNDLYAKIEPLMSNAERTSEQDEELKTLQTHYFYVNYTMSEEGLKAAAAAATPHRPIENLLQNQDEYYQSFVWALSRAYRWIRQGNGSAEDSKKPYHSRGEDSDRKKLFVERQDTIESQWHQLYEGFIQRIGMRVPLRVLWNTEQRIIIPYLQGRLHGYPFAPMNEEPTFK